MKKTMIAAAVLFLFTGIQSASAIDKLPIHLAGVALGEGLGIYSSVTCLINAQSDITKASSIVNLSLLGTGATMGLLSMLGVGDYQTMETIHKIVGYAVFAASVWLSVSTALDAGTQNYGLPWTSYGYSVASLAPVILFAIPF